MKPISLPTLKHKYVRFKTSGAQNMSIDVDDIGALLKVIEMQDSALKFYADPSAKVDVQIQTTPGSNDYWESIDSGNFAVKARAEVRKLVEFGTGET